MSDLFDHLVAVTNEQLTWNSAEWMYHANVHPLDKETLEGIRSADKGSLFVQGSRYREALEMFALWQVERYGVEQIVWIDYSLVQFWSQGGFAGKSDLTRLFNHAHPRLLVIDGIEVGTYPEVMSQLLEWAATNRMQLAWGTRYTVEVAQRGVSDLLRMWIDTLHAKVLSLGESAKLSFKQTRL